MKQAHQEAVRQPLAARLAKYKLVMRQTSGVPSAAWSSTSTRCSNNTDECGFRSPENVRPSRISVLHLFAENSESEYIAYVSEQNLCRQLRKPVRHPQIPRCSKRDDDGGYRPRNTVMK